MKPFLPGETVIQYGERLSAEIARLRAGLSALVNCRSPLTRAQMREAAAEVLAGKTTPMQDQSPFVETNARLRAENEKLVAACAACVPTTYLDPLLSGPDKIGGLQSGPPLEDLLRRIKERILALTNG